MEDIGFVMPSLKVWGWSQYPCWLFIPILKITPSYDYLIIIMGIPIPGKMVLIIIQGFVVSGWWNPVAGMFAWTTLLWIHFICMKFAGSTKDINSGNSQTLLSQIDNDVIDMYFTAELLYSIGNFGVWIVTMSNTKKMMRAQNRWGHKLYLELEKP